MLKGHIFTEAIIDIISACCAIAFIGKLPTGPSLHSPQLIPVYKPEGKGPWRVKQTRSTELIQKCGVPIF